MSSWPIWDRQTGGFRPKREKDCEAVDGASRLERVPEAPKQVVATRIVNKAASLSHHANVVMARSARFGSRPACRMLRLKITISPARVPRCKGARGMFPCLSFPGMTLSPSC